MVFIDFFGSVTDHWLFWVGLVLMIEPWLESASPGIAEYLKRFFSERPDRRRRIFRQIGLVALFFACFQAWHVQYDAVAQLQEQIKAKNDRAAIVAQLQIFYAEDQSLLGGRKITSDDDVTKYANEIETWKNKTAAWLNANMGPGAAARFEDITPYLSSPVFGYPGTFNSTHAWLMDYAGYLGRNLSAMIESRAWDKP